MTEQIRPDLGPRPDGGRVLLERRHTATSSVSFGYKRDKSLSSSTRLTRTNTNNTELDHQSIRTIDVIPSAKPNVTYADKLWTQIDVLDDVRNMANEVKQKGSFFSDDFNNKLDNLKLSQQKLLDTMYKQHYTNMKLHEQSVYKVDKNLGDNLTDKEEKQKLLDEFFNEKIVRESMYKKQNFDEMHDFIDEIKQDLVEVGDSMNEFDATVSSSWV